MEHINSSRIFIADLYHFTLFKAEKRGEPPSCYVSSIPDMLGMNDMR
jgi:hypothetical protein